MPIALPNIITHQPSWRLRLSSMFDISPGASDGEPTFQVESEETSQIKGREVHRFRPLCAASRGFCSRCARGSGGNLETNCPQKLVEVVTDALIEAIKLGLFLGLQF